MELSDFDSPQLVVGGSLWPTHSLPVVVLVWINLVQGSGRGAQNNELD